MTGLPAFFRIRMGASGRWITACLALAILVSLAAAVRDLASVVETKRVNQLLRDLAAGRDVAAEPADGPAALYARVRFLAERDKVDEAEALLPAFGDDAAPETLAAVQQVLGNARLRAAFRAGEQQRFDDAIPEVTLAKRAYRRALASTPESYDLKVNLDIAMRLVRDFPEGGEEEGVEEPDTQPKNLWSELPGVPEGLP